MAELIIKALSELKEGDKLFGNLLENSVRKNENIDARRAFALAFYEQSNSEKGASCLCFPYDQERWALGFFSSPSKFFNEKALAAFKEKLGLFFIDMAIPSVIAPIDGDTWHAYRVAHPDNEAFFLDSKVDQTLNHLLQGFGFRETWPYFSSIHAISEYKDDRMKRFSQHFEKQGVKIRPINTAKFERELEGLYALSIKAFAKNRFFKPLSKQAFMDLYLRLKPAIQAKYSLIAEDKNQEMIAFIFSFPDIENPSKKQMIIKTLASDPQYRGLGTFLVEKLYALARADGFEAIIHALMEDNNISRKITPVPGKTLNQYFLLEYKT